MLMAEANSTLEEKLLALLKQEAFAFREVILASGEKSNVYIDCKQVIFRGDFQWLMGKIFYQKLLQLEQSSSPSFEACAGMALGAVPLCVALSMTAFHEAERFFPSIAVRKNAKEHGTTVQLEGTTQVPLGSRVLLLEDVVTSGGSSLKAAKALREAGYRVDTIFALVDREAGGSANCQKEGIHLEALFHLGDFYA